MNYLNPELKIPKILSLGLVTSTDARQSAAYFITISLISMEIIRIVYDNELYTFSRFKRLVCYKLQRPFQRKIY